MTTVNWTRDGSGYYLIESFGHYDVAAKSCAGFATTGYTLTGTKPTTAATWLAANYKQTVDIDFELNSTMGTFGTISTYFSGIYDGQNHTLSNYQQQNITQVQTVSLFNAKNATIKNLKLAGQWRTKNNSLSCGQGGCLATVLDNCTVSNIAISAAINWSVGYQFGILAGSAINNTVIDGVLVTSTISYLNLVPSGLLLYIGGLIGMVTAGATITNVIMAMRSSITCTMSVASGTPTGYMGGIIGFVYSGTVNMNNVVNAMDGSLGNYTIKTTGASYGMCGGMVGYNGGILNITRSVVAMTGSLSSNKWSGGFVGYQNGVGTCAITSGLNYMKGDISGNTYAAGFIGQSITASAYVYSGVVAIMGNITGTQASLGQIGNGSATVKARYDFGMTLKGVVGTSDSLTNYNSGDFSYHADFLHLPYLTSSVSSPYTNTPFPNIGGNTTVSESGIWDYFTVTGAGCTQPTTITVSNTGVFLFQFKTSTNTCKAPSAATVTSYGAYGMYMVGTPPSITAFTTSTVAAVAVKLQVSGLTAGDYTSFRIYYGSSYVDIGTGTATYTISGLTAGTGYTFSVKAITAAGTWSSPYAVASVSTTTLAVPTVTGFASSAVTYDSITLAVSNLVFNTATAVRVYCGSTTFTALSGGTSTPTFASLTNGTSYTLSLQYIDGIVDWTSPRTLTAVSASTWTFPTIVSLETSDVSYTSMDIAWTSLTQNNAAAFRIYYTPTNYVSMSAGTNTTTITALTEDTGYTLILKYIDAERTWSNPLVLTSVIATTLKPPTLTNFALSAVTDVSATINITSLVANSATAFRVYYGTSSYMAVSTGTTSTVNEALVPSTAYTFTLKYIDYRTAWSNALTMASASTTTTETDPAGSAYTLSVTKTVKSLAVSASPSTTAIHVGVNGIEMYHTTGSITIQMPIGSTYSIRCNNEATANEVGTLPVINATNVAPYTTAVQNGLGVVNLQRIEADVLVAIKENFSAVFATNDLIHTKATVGSAAKAVATGITYLMQQSAKTDAIMVDAQSNPTIITTPSGLELEVTKETDATTITIGGHVLALGEAVVIGDYLVSYAE